MRAPSLAPADHAAGRFASGFSEGQDRAQHVVETIRGGVGEDRRDHIGVDNAAGDDVDAAAQPQTRTRAAARCPADRLVLGDDGVLEHDERRLVDIHAAAEAVPAHGARAPRAASRDALTDADVGQRERAARLDLDGATLTVAACAARSARAAERPILAEENSARRGIAHEGDVESARPGDAARRAAASLPAHREVAEEGAPDDARVGGERVDGAAARRVTALLARPTGAA